MSNPHKLSNETQESHTVNGKTYWRPAVPYPFFTTKGLPFWKRWNEENWRPQCDCGKIFKTLDEYNEHYRAQAEIIEVTT